jgi:hypothetical protein
LHLTCEVFTLGKGRHHLQAVAEDEIACREFPVKTAGFCKRYWVGSHEYLKSLFRLIPGFKLTEHLLR